MVQRPYSVVFAGRSKGELEFLEGTQTGGRRSTLELDSLRSCWSIFMRLVLLVLGVAFIAIAQEDHSADRNPIARLGAVALSTSCNPSAQTLISRGAAMLHSFGYEEARLTFLA